MGVADTANMRVSFSLTWYVSCDVDRPKKENNMKTNAGKTTRKSVIVQTFVEMLDRLDQLTEQAFEIDGCFVGFEGPQIQLGLVEIGEFERAIDCAQRQLWRAVQTLGVQEHVGRMCAEQHQARFDCESKRPAFVG